MARQDYIAAKKCGDATVRFCTKQGLSPYPPVLDQIEDAKDNAGEVRLGLLELPLDRINGNKELGRNNAFARDFMPILSPTSEFGLKWAALNDSYANEGIRDAILVYEYMNQYYVQEGNKRVSVSKYGGSEFILADVIRILPKRDDTKESRLYYEYLDFYKSTKNHYIVFSELGMYQKLADLLGQTLGDRWDAELCQDLKAAFFSFCKKSALVLKDDAQLTLSDAFLIYISIFPLKSLLSDTKDQILKNIRMARRELLMSMNIDRIDFVGEMPEEAGQKGLLGLFTPNVKYTAASPLRAAFIYDKDVEVSRWIDSHEAGRLYVEEVTGDNVKTACYLSDYSVTDALEQALRDKNELIFVVTPGKEDEVLRTALERPDVKFFTCGMARPSAAIRSYHAKLYEAAFLMGVYCGQLMTQLPELPHRIGYMARTFENTATVNAFAIGVSMIDPSCKILLECVTPDQEARVPALREAWRAQGIRYHADFEYPLEGGKATRPGVFRTEDGQDVSLGVPFFRWGKYYAQIIQSVLSGAFNAADLVSEKIAKNYWFGLSTEVVDIRIPNAPYQTRKLLSFIKDAITNGRCSPFSGELHSQDHVIQDDTGVKGSELETLTPAHIASMRWLAENIEGSLLDE